MKTQPKHLLCLWHDANLATKSLMAIGLISLIMTFVMMYDSNQTYAGDVAIRSVLSSTFGFLFGAQTKANTNITNGRLQITIASFVAITCLIATLMLHFHNVSLEDHASAVEVRNLLFSAVGFLLSKAQAEKEQ